MITIHHEGYDYCIELKHNELQFYRQERDETGLSQWGSDKSIIHNQSITNDTRHPVALMKTIAGATANLIHSNNLSFYMFEANDSKRARLYRAFAERISGYRFAENSGWFYLYKI